MKKFQLIITFSLIAIILVFLYIFTKWGGQIELSILVALITLFVSIITYLLLLLINLYGDILNRPELIFTVGLGIVRQNLPDKKMIKKIKKTPISGIAYIVQAPKNSICFFYLPFILINHSKSPIKNISISIKMPTKYVLTNEEISIMMKEKLINSDSNILKNRIIRTIGKTAQLEINVPILREEENICLLEMIKLDNFYSQYPIYDIKYYHKGKPMEGSITLDKSNDFCIANITIYSETSPPISKKIKLLWFDGTEKELLYNIKKSVDTVFGGGLFSLLRTYFRPWPMKPLFSYENWEIKKAHLAIMHKKQNITGYLESLPLPSENHIIELKMPLWE